MFYEIKIYKIMEKYLKEEIESLCLGVNCDLLFQNNKWYFVKIV